MVGQLGSESQAGSLLPLMGLRSGLGEKHYVKLKHKYKPTRDPHRPHTE